MINSLLNVLIDLARHINTVGADVFAGLAKNDIIFLAAFIVASALFAFILRRRKVIVFLMAIYITTALYQALPFSIGVKLGNSVWVFLLGIAIVYSILNISIARSSSGFSETGQGTRWSSVFILSLAIIGFLISSALNFVTDWEILNNLQLVNKLFLGDISKFVWALLPLGVFLFLRRR